MEINGTTKKISEKYIENEQKMNGKQMDNKWEINGNTWK